MKLPRKFKIASIPVKPGKRSMLDNLSLPAALEPQPSHSGSLKGKRDRGAAPGFQMGLSYIPG